MKRTLASSTFLLTAWALFAQTSPIELDSLSRKNNEQKTPIIIDYNVVDFPFSNKSVKQSGLGGLIANPSMSQSLNITSSFYSATREGIYRLMNSKPSLKRYYKLTAELTDILTYFPIPLTSGWLHEEFHRAVFAKHGGYSYNEMNSFPITKSLISVLNDKDEDLIALKRNSPQDMVRMAEAGIEGECVLANQINKTAFYHNAKSVSIIPILSTINSAAYVIMCSGKKIDKENNSMYEAEGSNINKRDLLGLDFLSWVYDLYRPNEPYENRGIHPSGVGIDRYIKRSQLTHSELSYLRQQGFLQLINLANPMSFWFTSFTLNKNANADDTRANLYFNHWLSSFGFDISTTGLLHHNKNNYAFTLHNYANYYKWFPGIEVETYNYLIGNGIWKRPLPLTAKAMLWIQPENQLFFSKKGTPGGYLEAKIHYPINKHFQPYVTLSAKTAGWVQGNVYLEKKINGGIGVRSYF